VTVTGGDASVRPSRHADLRNVDYVAWKQFLAQSSTWSADHLASHQLLELQRVVRDAVTNAPAWRALYAAHGLGADAVVSLDDVRKLPTVRKEDIRGDLEGFSIAMPGRTRTATGGSTGIPFELYRDPHAFAKELASKAHQYGRIGWTEGDPQLVLRGLTIDTPSHMTLVEEFNELRCSSYHLVPEVMEQYRRAAIEYRPDWLRCYPSIGDLFAQFIEDSGGEFPPVKGILCASENLYDGQRARMSRVFNTRVFSHYGHYELAALAGYCEHRDTYHVLPQYGYVELLAPDDSLVQDRGQLGEIVATSFINHGTPLIRYRTGDFAVFDTVGCSACDRPYQVWSRIEGRLHEFIVTSTGRLISMTALNAHDDTFDGVRQFQFEQKDPGRVTLRYVPRGVADSAVESHIRSRLANKLGDDIHLDVQPVDAIEPTKRGKHRFLIQHLPVVPGDSD
jgi:phenylacetate-CoA ligase